MNLVGQIVVFKLGNELFGVTISEIREIINKVKISKVPQMPKAMKGITNLRGKVTAIYDLGEKFGLGERGYLEKSKIIISNDGDIGFIVDDVKEIIDISSDNIESAGYLRYDQLVAGFAKINDDIITIVNLNALKEQEIFNVITA